MSPLASAWTDNMRGSRRQPGGIGGEIHPQTLQVGEASKVVGFEFVHSLGHL